MSQGDWILCVLVHHPYAAFHFNSTYNLATTKLSWSQMKKHLWGRFFSKSLSFNPFFFISCFPNIIVPFAPCTIVSIHLPVTVARLLILLSLLETTLYQSLPFPSPASISPAAAEALSQVDGSCHSLAEPPCPPLTPLIHLYTLYTDLERRGQIKKDHFPVSSLLLMSLLLSHLLSLFFCWLKFDFHHPSPPLPPLPSITTPYCLPSAIPSSLQGSYQKSPEAKDKSDLGNSCELLFFYVIIYCFVFFYIISTFFHPQSVSNLHWQVVHKGIIPDKFIRKCDAIWLVV